MSEKSEIRRGFESERFKYRFSTVSKMSRPVHRILKLTLFQNITDDAVKDLSEQCPRLHYVCLSNCPNLTDASLVTLAQHCPLLSVLECVACTHFTDAGFQALAKVSEHFLSSKRTATVARDDNSSLLSGSSISRTADYSRRWTLKSAF